MHLKFHWTSKKCERVLLWNTFPQFHHYIHSPKMYTFTYCSQVLNQIRYIWEKNCISFLPELIKWHSKQCSLQNIFVLSFKPPPFRLRESIIYSSKIKGKHHRKTNKAAKLLPDPSAKVTVMWKILTFFGSLVTHVLKLMTELMFS